MARPAGAGGPVRQSFTLLRITFTVAPILLGLDKFFNSIVEWPHYLAPPAGLQPRRQRPAVHVSGRGRGDHRRRRPVVGGYVVARAWLRMIILNAPPRPAQRG